jgi:hypothetical protein
MDTFGWIMLFLSVVAGIGTFLTWRSNKKHRRDHGATDGCIHSDDGHSNPHGMRRGSCDLEY